MRLREGDQVVETFQRTQGIELIHERAADVFFEALKGVTDPEDKRKIIGEKFIRIFEQAQGGIETHASSSKERCTPMSSNQEPMKQQKLKVTTT